MTASSELDTLIQALSTPKTGDTNPTKQKDELGFGTSVEEPPVDTTQIEILKTPRGTRDYGPGEMAIREDMMKKIKRNFAEWGGQFVETPVFELRDILMDKYGEDEKLIYDLEDQEWESLSLRYDLTVPLARYVAMNRKGIKSPFKAARVGRVYRRDQPRMTKGRMREFWQCDLDFVRTGDPVNEMDLVCDDAETVCLAANVLRDLDFGPFKIRLNNRKILDCILETCNVPTDLIRAVCSAIDKLDKRSWEEVKLEIMNKGLGEEDAEKIKRFVEISGPCRYVLSQLKAEPAILQSERAMEGVREFEVLLDMIAALDVHALPLLEIDMSMVRGLDYYTGIILEAVSTEEEVAAEVGSLCGGGRYDGLIGRFLEGNEVFPCVGMSIGFERIFSILETKNGVGSGALTKCVVVEVGRNVNQNRPLGLMPERLKLVNELRRRGIPTEYMPKIAANFRDQIDFAEARGAPYLVILGEEEVQEDKVNLRRLVLVGDMVRLQDGTAGVVRRVALEGEKRPQYFYYIQDTGTERREGKKSLAAVVVNGEDFALQIRGLARSEVAGYLARALYM